MEITVQASRKFTCSHPKCEVVTYHPIEITFYEEIDTVPATLLRYDRNPPPGWQNVYGSHYCPIHRSKDNAQP